MMQYTWMVTDKHGQQFTKASNLNESASSLMAAPDKYIDLTFMADNPNLPTISVQIKDGRQLVFCEKWEKAAPESVVNRLGCIDQTKKPRVVKTEYIGFVDKNVSFVASVDIATGNVRLGSSNI